MPLHLLKILVLLVLISCGSSTTSPQNISNTKAPDVPPAADLPYTNVAQIPLPDGYKRIEADSNSFTAWLRSIPLKKSTTVYLFNGTPKHNQGAQFAVLDISVGKTDLQQCADAVMRLRAEYLFKQKAFEHIIFTDNEGTAYLFKQPCNRQNFDSYLNRVFCMCGTASLSKQMEPVDIKQMQPGDAFVHGGFPGHAEIILDMAMNSSGDKIYLLAQSYMPAQDIHILKDLSNKNLSPWYKLGNDEIIETPEYSFTKYELKKW